MMKRFGTRSMGDNSINFSTALEICVNLDGEELQVKNGDGEVHYHHHPFFLFLFSPGILIFFENTSKADD